MIGTLLLVSVALSFPQCEPEWVFPVWQVPSCLIIERGQFEEQFLFQVVGRVQITIRWAIYSPVFLKMTFPSRTKIDKL